MKLCLRCSNKFLETRFGVIEARLHCGYGLEDPIKCDYCGIETDCYVEILEVKENED